MNECTRRPKQGGGGAFAPGKAGDLSWCHHQRESTTTRGDASKSSSFNNEKPSQ